MGLKAQDRVAILAETRADWIIAAYGCFQNSITIVTLYTNLGNDGVAHALNETEVESIICSTETIGKIQAVKPDCPNLKRIICMESLTPSNSPAVKVTNAEVVMFGRVVQQVIIIYIQSY